MSSFTTSDASVSLRVERSLKTVITKGYCYRGSNVVHGLMNSRYIRLYPDSLASFKTSDENELPTRVGRYGLCQAQSDPLSCHPRLPKYLGTRLPPFISSPRRLLCTHYISFLPCPLLIAHLIFHPPSHSELSCNLISTPTP